MRSIAQHWQFGQLVDSLSQLYASHLLRNEAETLLRADKLVCLAKEGIEGFAGALSSSSVSTDCKARHMHQPLVAARGEFCSLQQRVAIRQAPLYAKQDGSNRPATSEPGTIISCYKQRGWGEQVR